jgi:hypothetical protein
MRKMFENCTSLLQNGEIALANPGYFPCFFTLLVEFSCMKRFFKLAPGKEHILLFYYFQNSTFTPNISKIFIQFYAFVKWLTFSFSLFDAHRALSSHFN